MNQLHLELNSKLQSMLQLTCDKGKCKWQLICKCEIVLSCFCSSVSASVVVFVNHSIFQLKLVDFSFAVQTQTNHSFRSTFSRVIFWVSAVNLISLYFNRLGLVWVEHTPNVIKVTRFKQFYGHFKRLKWQNKLSIRYNMATDSILALIFLCKVFEAFVEFVFNYVYVHRKHQ